MAKLFQTCARYHAVGCESMKDRESQEDIEAKLGLVFDAIYGHQLSVLFSAPRDGFPHSAATG
jgi:hypothetical protein